MAKKAFYTEILGTWGEIHRYQKEGWVYRGQKLSNWGLKTTLERACKSYDVPLRRANIIENVLLREFRRKYHQYSLQWPSRSDSLEWFSLMQHYGAPTRLLDFTYSIYVAAYFALEHAEGKSAVWAINGNWAINKSAALFDEKSPEREYLTGFIEEGKEPAFENIFMRNNHEEFACPQNPFRLNERLTAQKGVFMLPGDVTRRFESNLCALPGWEDKRNIVKLLIPHELRRDALRSLSNMTISYATLFPDLGGFAHSLRVSLPVRWDLIGISKKT